MAQALALDGGLALSKGEAVFVREYEAGRLARSEALTAEEVALIGAASKGPARSPSKRQRKKVCITWLQSSSRRRGIRTHDMHSSPWYCFHLQLLGLSCICALSWSGSGSAMQPLKTLLAVPPSVRGYICQHHLDRGIQAGPQTYTMTTMIVLMPEQTMCPVLGPCAEQACLSTYRLLQP